MNDRPRTWPSSGALLRTATAGPITPTSTGTSAQRIENASRFSEEPTGEPPHSVAQVAETPRGGGRRIGPALVEGPEADSGEANQRGDADLPGADQLTTGPAQRVTPDQMAIPDALREGRTDEEEVLARARELRGHGRREDSGASCQTPPND